MQVASQVTAEVTATNTPSQSRIKIVKTDSLTKTPLPGAVFSITDENGQTIATLSTGTDGTATSDWLPYGVYHVSEVSAPEHYINDGFHATVEAYEDGRTYTFEVENTPTLGMIWVSKWDALDDRPIGGVTFDVYQGTQLICSMTTNESGFAHSPDLEKGVYTIKERALPEGYTGELVELTAQVFSDEETKLTVTNMPIQGRVKILKKDALTGAALSGATFEITDESGQLVSTLTTDANGTAESDLLRYGEYTITETVTPEHYENSHFTATFFIAEQDKPYVIEVSND